MTHHCLKTIGSDSGWGQFSGAYSYQDGAGINTQFTNGNTVTTLSLGADGSSSATSTQYDNAGSATGSTFYNSNGQATGASIVNNGVVTTYNRCGQEGSPGEACTWVNPSTGESVYVSF